MKSIRSILLIVPVLIATMAVGFILYRGAGVAEGTDPAADLEVNTGSATDSQYQVPDDIYFTEPLDAVVFSHGTHAVALGIKCGDCHTALFQMKAHDAESKPDFNMAGLAEGKYCGACHSAKTEVAFASDTECARCHVGVKGVAGEQE